MRPETTDKGLQTERYSDFPLVKRNFIFMAAAAIITVVGFLLMLGSGSTAEEFNPDIFSTRRIVVGPTIAFIGFILMGVAIMWPGGRKSDAPADATTDTTDKD